MERQKLAALAVFVLIISLLLGACSSSQTARGANDQMLDLDYVSTGNDAAEEEQADEPWYAWIKRAFSFGKTDDDTKAEDKPDSVADLYKKGTENLKKQMESAVALYDSEMSLQAIGEELGLNPIKVRKLLITAGVYESEVAEKVQATFQELLIEARKY